MTKISKTIDTIIDVDDYKGLDSKHYEELSKQGITTNKDLSLLYGDDDRIKKVSTILRISPDLLSQWVSHAHQLDSEEYAPDIDEQAGLVDSQKSEFLHAYFDQVETQVQFADTRAALLVAGNAILLSINGRLIELFSGCPNGEFSVACAKLSIPFILSLGAALLLLVSVAFAFWAALPSKIHKKPPGQFFLLSYVARLDEFEFIRTYEKMPLDQLYKEALIGIHGKAKFATFRFGRIKKAIRATLLSLMLQIGAIIVAVIQVSIP